MYKPILDIIKTEKAIKILRTTFEEELAYNLGLTRVSAPMMVLCGEGLNDNLNGTERPVEFKVDELGQNVEIVHSLAKWKRYALAKYNFPVHTGLYTNMNAIRRDEHMDNLHSIYVDQWDWEYVIEKRDRNIEYLKYIVNRIYNSIKTTENKIASIYPKLATYLSPEIHFITSQELEDKYPHLTPKEREKEEVKQYGTIFVIGIGGRLKSGIKHDGRAPDYDDWNLNGDLIMYYEPLDCAFEISSMGIRVDKESLIKQCKEEGCEDRLELPFHKMLISGELPYTIGGGIGQSRLSMFLLKKIHIGEVQSSLWDKLTLDYCKQNNIPLL